MVLVIDEHRDELDASGRMLRGAGFKVALASTGLEGLRLAEQRAIDLVVADLRLADITGIEVLRRLRQELVDTPVIVTGLATTSAPRLRMRCRAAPSSISSGAPCATPVKS